MSKRPTLKSFRDLTAVDFERHPVWINCHTADYDQPWYDDTDEETFRPHVDALPVDPSTGMYLVHAILVLADGTQLPGFLTPGTGAPKPGEMQPHLFVGNATYGFWGGMVGVAESRKAAMYAALGKTEFEVFPIQVFARPNLTTGTSEIVVPGWLGIAL